MALSETMEIYVIGQFRKHVQRFDTTGNDTSNVQSSFSQLSVRAIGPDYACDSYTMFMESAGN